MGARRARPVPTNLSTLSPTPTKVDVYHGKGRRGNRIPPERRAFIAWDGEGVNLRGDDRPQSYVLFGSSVNSVQNPQGLSTFEILDHIVETGKENPGAFHVGFAFNYDSNMIVRGFRNDTLQRLHDKGSAYVRKKDGTRYLISFTPGKFFRVTRYGPKFDAKKNTSDKVTVTIEDMFSFFACSFVKAYEDLVGPIPDKVKQGKLRRGSFTSDDMSYVWEYWSEEIQCLRALAEELRRRVYGAGLLITRWYGPGALASYAMGTNGIKKHLGRSPDDVRSAARYGYAGGRFELYKVGRTVGPIYGIDINSAYPSAIAELPSLSEGEWVYESYSKRPTKLARFGIYHMRMRLHAGFDKIPGPLFHRDRQHNISYPWIVEGWYWSPEAKEALRIPGVEVIEGWHYLGSQTLPFQYIREMYETRRQWKAEGKRAQIALKLCMNSHYGKMAQRVGWDPETGRIPPWHQLEWAGWVTSHTRAKLYSVMRQIPWENLIAVETDGIYTTTSPVELGLSSGSALGEWEITEYDEAIYIQSGLAWLRSGDTWVDKRRGLDSDSFSLVDAQDYVRTLSADNWHPFMGKTTRFIGLGAALQSNAPTKVRHCVWQTRDREISPGLHGKRIHLPPYCAACQKGATAYEMPHDLVIRSFSGFPDAHSFPHYIPWEENRGNPQWIDEEINIGEPIRD